MEKGDTWGSNNTTCVDGQLTGDIRVFSGFPEQVMSEAIGKVMSVLGSCEKSRDHLRHDISIVHRGMGQKALLHKAQRALFLKGAQVLKLLWIRMRKTAQ